MKHVNLRILDIKIYLKTQALLSFYLRGWTNRLGAFDDLFWLAFFGEVGGRAELSVGGLAQNGEFLDQLLGGGESFSLAFLFDVGLAALQAAVDQQADILAGVLGTVPVAGTSLFVLVVGIENGGLEGGALFVASGRWHFGDFLQAGEFGLDVIVADDVSSSGQNGFGLGLLVGISSVVAGADAGANRPNFCAILFPFLRVQSRHYGVGVAFGQLLAEFASLGQHLGEPFAVFVLHHASARATVADALDVPLEAVIGHSPSRESESQNQDQLHG